MAEASVTKSVMETYTVRTGHERAIIGVRCWEHSNKELGYHCGEIMINSTYGTWANVWTACGSPFKEFLQQIEFDYAFGKFMGSALDVFDEDASIKEVKRKVIEERRTIGLDKEEARDLWDQIEGIDTYSEEAFVAGCQQIARDLGNDHPLHDTFTESWYLICKKPDVQATGFLRDIWPHFMAELKREAEPAPYGVRVDAEASDVGPQG